MNETSLRKSEFEAFLESLDRLPPNALTACQGWTVHEIVAHLTAGSDEIARLIEAYGEGRPVPPTRGFEEREAPYRAMDDAELRQRLLMAGTRMRSALQAVLREDPHAVIPFTGLHVKVASFALHARSELALHRWDMVGDDELSWQLLGQPELTAHAVNVMSPLLLARGCSADRQPGASFTARLRVPGALDILVRRDSNGATLDLQAPAEGPVLESDAAARLLFIWGRRPGDRSRLRSHLSRQDLVRLETLLAGF